MQTNSVKTSIKGSDTQTSQAPKPTNHYELEPTNMKIAKGHVQ